MPDTPKTPDWTADDRRRLHDLLARMAWQRRRNPTLGLTCAAVLTVPAVVMTVLTGWDWGRFVLWGLGMHAAWLMYRVGWMDRHFEHQTTASSGDR